MLETSMPLKVQVWICTKTEVLLLRTTSERNSIWQPVTGHVEGEESFHKAAFRELIEETGLNHAPAVNPLDMHFTFEARGKKFEEEVFYSLIHRSDEITLDPKEHVDFKWMSFDEAEKQIPFDAQKEAIKKLQTVLKGK